MKKASCSFTAAASVGIRRFRGGTLRILVAMDGSAASVVMFS